MQRSCGCVIPVWNRSFNLALNSLTKHAQINYIKVPTRTFFKRVTDIRGFYALVDEFNIVKKQQESLSSETLSAFLQKVNPHDVFVAEELDMSKINAVGFDYDYTLAKYKPNLQTLIYNMISKRLVNDAHYPAELLSHWAYDPNFAIRGLFYDAHWGLLLKLDSHRNIQPGTVYKGRTPVSAAEVRRMYGGMRIWKPYLEEHMNLLSDYFSLPEACLMANIVQIFMNRDMPFDYRHLYSDVKYATTCLHRSGDLHRVITSNIDQYLVGPDRCIKKLLLSLRSHGKSTFLLSNSPFWFIDQGMKHIVGNDWREELFDVVIASAQKPSFYASDNPFRNSDIQAKQLKWQSVDKFLPNHVYVEGSLKEFKRITGWDSDKVLYFGDHIHADLVDASATHGWRTGAIMPELAREVQLQSEPEYNRSLLWLQYLDLSIQRAQSFTGANPPNEMKAIIEGWKVDRIKTQQKIKVGFNAQFGSPVRTTQNPSYLSDVIMMYADIYTSSLDNLLEFGPNHHFLPRRIFLPHEAKMQLTPGVGLSPTVGCDSYCCISVPCNAIA